MRRKAGTLVPLEASILEAALRLRRDGTDEAYGFLLARIMRDGAGAKRLTAYGSLYRALERLEGFGFLESRWEDPAVALELGRPPRRFYRLRDQTTSLRHDPEREVQQGQGCALLLRWRSRFPAHSTEPVGR
jgi:DNA-binding PadR family transcriptional regulator